MKKLLSLPILLLMLAFALAPSASAAAIKLPGKTEISNGMYYHSWSSTAPRGSASGDTLVFMADTTTGKAPNVAWFSTSGLRPVSANLNPAFTDSIRLAIVINGDADGSIMTTRGEVSYNSGASWVTVVTKADTTTDATWVYKFVSMPHIPDVLYRWRLVTTSVTDSTRIANGRGYVVKRNP